MGRMKINLIEYFEETVKKYPDRIAVSERDEIINFKNLYRTIVITAGHIIEKLGDQINKPIAVFLPKSISSIQSNIAISYSGNFYMNLDVKSPETRIKNIISLIHPSLIITNTEYLKKLKNIDEHSTILNIDTFSGRAINEKDLIMKRLERIIDTDPHCIINTSGSTGTPKGVVLNHKSFIDFIEWSVDTLKIKEDEIVGSLSPLVFDIYSFELCMMMSRGSTIILIPESLSAFPVNILKIMQEKAVSFIFWVPTIMVNIANMDLLSRLGLPDLKTVWFAGEVFPTKQFNYWKRNLQKTKFVNLYGPIEITLDCTYYIVDRELKDDEPIPIGFPCRNTEILILNDQNEIATKNEIGELCVRGTSLAMGYYNNPEKTANAFVQNPLNTSYPEIIYRTGDLVFKNELNEIIFKGRIDSLVKHLGYRIELGEIEHVIINSLKLVENGCVVYNFSKKEIVLFYESASNIETSEIRKKLGEIFPKYMIPTGFIKMNELPRNTNGKVDRLYLSNKANDK
jgi:amino acid adenylation domain-containing protein